MIVVDSSVWISFFANQITPETIRLQALANSEPIIVGDIVMLEVLRGARTEQQAERMEARLRQMVVVEMLDVATARQAARHYRLLRAKGSTIRGTVDLIIGTYCIMHDHRLLQRDRDFGPMQQHLGLRLA